MLEASARRTLPCLLGVALVAAACGSDVASPNPSPGLAGSAGAAGMAGAGSGHAGAAGNGSAQGGANGVSGSPAGGSGAAGAAGTGGGSGGASMGGVAGSGGGGGGAGAAAGAGGAGGAQAGAGGAAGGLSYSTDPTTFGGQPRCQGFDVCESFESTEPGALPNGFTLEGYGTRKVGVSADRAMRGARSLKLEVAAQGAVTAWLTRSALGTLGQRHFGRAFFRIDGPAPSEFVHLDLLQGSGPYEGHTNAVRYASTGTGVGTGAANWSFIYNVQPSGNGAGSEFGTEGNRSAHPRIDDWMCLEWSFDATEQVAQYYLDGAAIDYLRIDTERAEIPVFDTLAVGFGKYQNTGAFLVYLDEVAFDGERIGCNN